jgi:hypothetical protein
MSYKIDGDTLIFRGDFYKSLDDFKCPDSIKTIKFGYFFNRDISNVKWPLSLENITFGWRFNQDISKVKWPMSLKSITFGEYFNQSLDNLPEGLETLSFVYLKYPLTNLPLTLKKLYINNKTEEIISQSKIPFGCEVIKTVVKL